MDASIYFFELRIPQSGSNAKVKSYIFPLALNPEAISFSEPFSVESTPTVGGGLVVEENGIITRTLRIRGTTGTFQRSFAGHVEQLALQTNQQKDFGRGLKPKILGTLSGQKLFQYLQDSIFRLYGSLKKDPNTSAKTSLIFHMPREMEAWVVVPTHFGNDRQAGRPLDYPYEFELLVVQKAEKSRNATSRNKATLDALKDPLKVAANYLKRVSTAIQALSAAQGQLRNYFRQLDVLLTQAQSIVTAVGNFVAGTTDLIEVPANYVRQLAALASGILQTFVQSRDGILNVPQVYEQSLRQLESAQYYLLLHPSNFAQANAAARQAEQATLDYEAAAEAAAALEAQTASALPTTLAQARALGTSITPEQVAMVQTGVNSDDLVVDYTGTHPYQVVRGDTLWNLAARFLGDGRLWRYIAAVNNLKPPYTTLQADLPLATLGTSPDVSALSLGDTLLIPDFSDPTANTDTPATLGVPTSAPVELKLFGADLALSTTSQVTLDSRTYYESQRLDWVVDPNSGGTALKVASGTDNLTQSVLTRVTLSRGEDPMFDNLGVNDLVPSGNSAIDGQVLAFNLRESLAQDPRVDQVLDLNVVATGQGDGLMLTGTVQARAYGDAIPLDIPLPTSATT